MPNPLSRYGVSDRDYAAAVATAVGEAGREGVQGMAAVIDVLANRAENPQYADAYGNSVSEQATARKGREFNAWMSGSPRTQAAFAQTMRALRAMASPTARARLPKAEQAQLAQAEKAAFGVLGTGDLRGITKGATRYANKAVTKRWGTNSAQDALEGEFGRLNIGNHTFTGPGFDPSREYDPERAFRNLESNWAYAQGGDTPGERLAAGRQQQALRETFSGASDFGAPVWDGNWTGDTRVESAPLGPVTGYDPLSSVSVPAANSVGRYDPLSSISAPMGFSPPAQPQTGATLAGQAISAARPVNEDRSSREPASPVSRPPTGAHLAGDAIAAARETPGSAALDQAMFSAQPMGFASSFGSFTPSFSDTSTFTGAPPPTAASAPVQATATRPPQPQTTLGVQPGFQPTGYDISVFQGVPLSDITPKAPFGFTGQQVPPAVPPAPRVAYDPLSSVQAPKPPPVADVQVPLPAEVPALAYAPPMPANRPVAPAVAAVSRPKLPSLPKLAPAVPEAPQRPVDPVQAFSQQVGSPQSFMSMNPREFGAAIGTLASLSPDALRINALAAQVSDPRVGIVAQNALQDAYAGATGQPQTRSLWSGLAGDLSQAFGFSPGLGLSNSPAASQGMYVQGADGSPVWANFSDDQRNALSSGGWGSLGTGPGTSALW